MARPLFVMFLGAAGSLFAATNSTQQVTFHKDVEPILQARCQNCHRPGEAAPMPLLTYKEARPWAKAMKQAVLSRKMPPWFADPSVGHFKNDRSLTAKELETLVGWADTGAREGDAKDAPAPLKFVDGWNIGKPDQVFEMPVPYEVPASGTIAYQYIIVPTNFKEDKWITASEVRPGNRSVVHHVIAFIREPGSKWLKDAAPGVPYAKGTGADEGGASGWAGGYVPGFPAKPLDPGQALLVKAGSDIVFQMHYTANGKQANDQTKIGFVFANEAPKERVFALAVQNRKFVIPAGAANYKVDGALTLWAPSRLIGLTPHMHLRGKAFEFRALYPDGKSEKLVFVPKYDFNWQLTYEPAEDKILPAGTRLECSAWFDNSPNNPNNPDPKTEVRWGDQSWEEMVFGGLNIAVDAKSDPRDLLRAPKKPSAD